MRVLITGTSQGIGKEIALKFILQGHSVIGIDKQEASIYQDEFYTHYKVDVRNKEDFPDLGNVDIVINNAGTQNEDDINTNLIGTINITERYAINNPDIKAVLMIGSASGHTGSEFPEYCASKGGVLTYAKNVALRIARYGAVCNSLDLGGVLTESNNPVIENYFLWEAIMDLTPLRKWMTVEEVAEWAYFLTVTNTFCSGQNILVDGLEAGNSKFIWPGR